MIMTFMLAPPHDIPHLSAQALSPSIHNKQVHCRKGSVALTRGQAGPACQVKCRQRHDPG